MAFNAAIDHGPFGVLSSWNDSVHYCDWNGILCSCRHRHRVVALNLRSRGLLGSLSPHRGNLSFHSSKLASAAQSHRRWVACLGFEYYNSTTIRLVVGYQTTCGFAQILNSSPWTITIWLEQFQSNFRIHPSFHWKHVISSYVFRVRR